MLIDIQDLIQHLQMVDMKFLNQVSEHNGQNPLIKLIKHTNYLSILIIYT